MPETFIPYHRPCIGDEEHAAVEQVLHSGWLTTGPVAQQFAREFAAYVGAKHALTVNSATAALQLAFDAIGLRPGDEVLVPTYTFTATAATATFFGGRPILCDSLPGEFNLDVTKATLNVTERTRAIVPVHIAGLPCDMDAVQALAACHRLHVIEDAAHALPASWRGKRIGSVSELTAFSFYATKTITTGEGGMLTTDDEDYAARATTMRLHGISGDAWKRYAKEGSWYYEVEEAGYKLNLPDVLAAMGTAQLAKADKFAAQRRQIAARYAAAFGDIEELELPPRPPSHAEHAWHLYILRICPEQLSLNHFIEKLKSLATATSVHFVPPHLHPYYQRTYGYRRGDFPAAEDAFDRCMSLPIFPGMTEREVDRVIAAVMQIVDESRKRVAVAA